MQEGQPVALASRALTPTDQNNAQIEECLSIVFSCFTAEKNIGARFLILDSAQIFQWKS